MQPILVECPPSNGVALLLVGTTVVGSGVVDVSFLAGEDVEMLFLSIIIAAKRSVILSLVSFWLSVSSMSFSSLFLWFLSDYCLLSSIGYSMMSNFSSDLVFILLPPFGIWKFGL